MKQFKESRDCQRFSIRKVSFGATSVLLGTIACLGTTVVSADEVQDDKSLVAVVAEETSHHTTNSLQASADIREGLALIEQEIPEVTDGDVIPVLGTKEEDISGVVATDTKPDELLTPQAEQPVNVTAHQLSDEVELEQNDLSKNTVSIFRTAQHTPIGDNYPQVWKNGIVWQSADKWNLYVKECVSFAAFRLSTVNGFEMPPAYGNAKEWGHRARREGYRVDMTPAVGAVAWFDAYQFGAYDFGHVAWVSHISGDQVEIEEYNYGLADHAYNRRTIHKSQVSGYIHFKDVIGGTPSPINKVNNTTLPSSGQYTFTKRSSVKVAPKQTNPEIAYYDAGQSVHYDKVVKADGYEWISYLSYSGNRRYIAIQPLVSETPKLSGKLTVSHQDDEAGTFDVIISQVPQDARIRTIKIGVWSTVDGKDDMVWHTARQQSNGQYKVTVDIAQHDDYRGEYKVQLQYVTQDRQKVTLTTKTVVVGHDVVANDSTDSGISNAPKHHLPPNGTYRFTQKAYIKAEPSTSSPDLAYYNVGDTVNYDRIVQAEGKHWLSYLSYAGNRRYIALP